jgi:hypothetical protein
MKLDQVADLVINGVLALALGQIQLLKPADIVICA